MRLAKLQDITTQITDGKHGDCNNEDSSGYYFVSCKDVYDGSIHYEQSRQITKDDCDDVRRRIALEPGDSVITNSGTIGRMAFATDRPETYRTAFQKSVAVVKPRKGIVEPEYLYYLLLSCVSDMARNSNGSAQKNLLLSTMREYELSFHESKDMQRRLVEIISAYDNLIENNRRQIALLEEAAQRLYKEWFVDLRFPGHQNTEVVDGLPNGWTKCELGAVIHQSGNAEKKSNRENYSHYLPIDSIPSKSITCWDSDAIENASSSLVAFKRDDFVFGAMRPYFHKVIIAPYAGLTRTTCFVLNVGDPDYWAYAFAVLTFGDCVRYATSISVGTTMPYVRWEDLRHMPIVVPTKELAITFKSHFDNIRMRVEVLYKQLAEAREARDRLLPKLMSGEIEVEG